MQRIYNFKNTLTLAAIITLCRIIYLYLNHLNLHPDEAQYWLWSRDLALGYYSKPPVIAWLIGLSTNVCGEGEPCIRLFSPLLHLATAMLIFSLAKYLWDEKTGFFSALGYLLLPGVTFSALLMTTDAPLLFFWAGALLFFVHAMREGKPQDWLLCGVFVGFGLLTKYTMAVFIFSALIYIFTTVPSRLKSWKPWATGVVAFMIFLPNLIWNMENGFLSFRHTEDNLNPGAPGFAVVKMLEFLGAQVGIFGPIFFCFFVFILLFRLREIIRDEKYRLLCCFFLPLFTITLAVAASSRAHGNWAAPIYVSAVILVTAWMVEHEKTGWIRAALALHLAVALVLYNWHGQPDPLARLRGWREFSLQVAEMKSRHPGAEIFTDERKIAAELSYYLRNGNNPVAIYKWNRSRKIRDHFDLARSMAGMKGLDFIFVARNDGAAEPAGYFVSIAKEKTLPLPANPKLTYAIYYMKDFRGY